MPAQCQLETLCLPKVSISMVSHSKVAFLVDALIVWMGDLFLRGGHTLCSVLTVAGLWSVSFAGCQAGRVKVTRPVTGADTVQVQHADLRKSHTFKGEWFSS